MASTFAFPGKRLLFAHVPVPESTSTNPDTVMPLYAIVGRDHPDALERRLAARSRHIALGDTLAAAGALLFGAALIEDGKMKGSILIGKFDDRAAVQRWLDIEPYLTDNVWATVEVDEIRVGPSFADRYAPLGF